jgi:ABC-2 type transport system permease protein
MTSIAAENNPPRRRGAVNLPGLWTLFLLTLRQHLHGKRWMIMLGLFLLPAGLSLAVRCTAPRALPGDLEFVFVFMFIPQAILPLAALIYASGMIQDEQEEQTITYLLIRPLSKWAIYVVKLLATLLTVGMLTAVFTGITYVVIFAQRVQPDTVSRCLTAAGIHSLAVVCYCCLFGLMAMLTRRILVCGIIYIALVEGLFANLAFGIRLITVIYYTRIIAYRTLDFVVMGRGRMPEDPAADAWQLDVQNDPKLLTHPQFSTCLAVLLIGSFVCAVVAAYICSRKEFHVKTPEQN